MCDSSLNSILIRQLKEVEEEEEVKLHLKSGEFGTLSSPPEIICP